MTSERTTQVRRSRAGIGSGIAAILIAGAVAGCGGGTAVKSPTAVVRRTSAPSTTTTAIAPSTTTTTTTTLPPTPTVWVLTQNLYSQSSGVGPAALVPIDPATGTAGTPVPIPSADDTEFGGGKVVAVDPAGRTAYVEGPSGMVALDLATGRAGAPFGVNDYSSMTFSPDGRTAYAVDPQNATLIPVDLTAGTPGTPISMGESMVACANGTTHVVVTPAGDDAYVESTGGFFHDVDLTTGVSSPAFQVPTSSSPADQSLTDQQNFGPDSDIALQPDGSTLWVLQSGTTEDDLTPLTVDGDTAGPSLAVPISPRPTFAPTPEGDRAVEDAVDVPNDSTALVVTFGTTPEQVIPVDLVTRTVGKAITLTTAVQSQDCGPSYTESVAISPDARTAFVADPSSDAIHQVDLQTGVIGPEIPVGARPVAVLMSRGWPDTSPW